MAHRKRKKEYIHSHEQIIDNESIDNDTVGLAISMLYYIITIDFDCYAMVDITRSV